MVTAELAATLPALIFVLVVALNAVLIGIDQVRCVDAARVAARAAARGDSAAAVRQVGARAGPGGAAVEVRGGPGAAGGTVIVTVRAPVPGPFGWLTGGADLSATVTTPVESGAAAPAAGTTP
ncbi:TadE family type IV pilus minor pilin [Flexivirga meconopsidis]|uniref:TadE family type IV pilus minor pilin n=1 Tax=Flexivirga meconopsidis TaxID=2977121 RepID=UPI00223FABF4|nr:TadE family type IV pilus minor pilin [Flexivirga meconopsidis]